MTKPDAALDAIRRGFAVFPLASNSKKPKKGSNGFKDAMRDEAQIRAWWAEDPEANIGIHTESYLVVDVDPRHGGMESLKALLELIGDLPETLISKTAGGGFHYFYKLPAGVHVKSDASVLGEGIDVRSWGGYAAAPGSEIKGKAYEWVHDRPISPAPDWLIGMCQRAHPHERNDVRRVADEDEVGIALADEWLEKSAPSAHLGKIDTTANRVALRLFDYGLELETVMDRVHRWAEDKAEPMEDKDVLRVSKSARDNREEPIGHLHPSVSGFEAVDIAERAVPGPPRAPRAKLFYRTLSQGADLALSDVTEPLIEGLIDCGAMSVVYGESNSGKSFQEMGKDFHVAAGIEWNGHAVKQGAVVWVAAEGGKGINKRLAALRKHYGQADVPFFVVPCPVDLLRADADVKPLIELVKQIEADYGHKVVKITLDTLSRVIAGGDENSSIDMGKLVHHFDAIRDATQAHLAVIHHTGKDKAKGARGHSLLRAATDTEIEIDNRWITVTKQRDLEGGASFRFQLDPIEVGQDARGRRVVSCVVSFPTRPGEAKPLSDERRKVLFAAVWLLHIATDSKGIGWEDIHQSTIFCRREASDKVVGRSTITEHLSELTSDKWLKKVKPNQYVRNCRSLSELVGDSQVMLSELSGTLKGAGVRQTDIDQLVKKEGLLFGE